MLRASVILASRFLSLPFRLRLERGDGETLLDGLAVVIGVLIDRPLRVCLPSLRIG